MPKLHPRCAGRFLLAAATLGTPVRGGKVRLRGGPAAVAAPIADDFIGFGYEISAVAPPNYCHTSPSPAPT